MRLTPEATRLINMLKYANPHEAVPLNDYRQARALGYILGKLVELVPDEDDEVIEEEEEGEA